MNVGVKYEKQEVELQHPWWKDQGLTYWERTRVLRLNWKKLFKIQVDENNQESSLGRLIDQYSEVFQEGLKILTGPKAKLKQRQNRSS